MSENRLESILERAKGAAKHSYPVYEMYKRMIQDTCYLSCSEYEDAIRRLSKILEV